jgi:hypothetical protein
MLKLNEATLAAQAGTLGFKNGLNVSLVVDDSGTAIFLGIPPVQNVLFVSLLQQVR